MTTSDAHAPTDLTVNVSRVIHAPRERVFEAWIRPELRRKWWDTGRPEGLSVCEIDARVGGRYRMHQVGGCDDLPDLDPNYEWIMEGEFVEIVPPERLVFTWNVNHHPPVVNERVTIEFRAIEGGTEVNLTHVGIKLAPTRDGTEKGWTELLGHIAKLLEK